MRYILKFRENAIEDYQSSVSVDYYDKISPRLTDRFYSDFKATTDKIKVEPFHFQVKYRNIRIAFLSIFPFGIHFMVEKKTVHILRILHTKRRFS